MNYADIVSEEERQDARDWLDGMIAALTRTEASPQTEGADAGPVVNLTYGGQSVWNVLPSWEIERTSSPAGDGVTLHEVRRRDPETGLELTVEIRHYTDFPVVEWILRLKNTSDSNTPILADIRSMDVRIPLEGEAFLNYHTGDYCTADGYEPHCAKLSGGATFSFAPDGGRPTNRAWPFYNVECPDAGAGVIIVVGWSGQWSSSFKRSRDHLVATAGQEWTHLKLFPGEEIRAPISVLEFYRGDRHHAHNVWRRWMMAHNMPRPSGELPKPIRYASSSVYFSEMTRTDAEMQKFFIDRHVEERTNMDYWWMDAGWYPCDGHWPKTGTWEPDPERFPRGLREVSDHGLAKDVKIIVWFEPERVAKDTWLDTEHPEWLLDVGGSSKLLDLGNPDALRWLSDHVNRVITEQGIHLYRQDHNIDPLPFWRANDADDRQGITEIRYVEGYHAYWDALLERHPDMLIDSCASGGRRNDLETMRRAVPLHKTDYNYSDLPAKQVFHQMLPLWIPYFGASLRPLDTLTVYGYRSTHALGMGASLDMRRDDLDFDLARRMTDEWERISPYFYGDYYQLTPASRDEKDWLAWQYNHPDLDGGVIHVFRRAECPEDAPRLVLHGLEPDARYCLTDEETGATKEATGGELMESGLAVEMPDQPSSAVWTYRKL